MFTLKREFIGMLVKKGENPQFVKHIFQRIQFRFEKCGRNKNFGRHEKSPKKKSSNEKRPKILHFKIRAERGLESPPQV